MKKSALILIVLFAVAGCSGTFVDAADYFTGPVSGVGLNALTSIVSDESKRQNAVVVPAKTANNRVI